MKKLFTAVTLSAMSLAAWAAPTFDGYVTDPDPGIVSQIQDITVIFPGCEEVEFNTRDAVYMLDSNYDEVPGALQQGGNAIMFTPETTITAAGEYTLVIGEGALCGYDAEYNSVDNPSEIYITYVIEGGSQGGGGELNYLGYTSVPAEGEVEALSEIKVTFPNIFDVDFNSKKDVVLTHNGTAVEGIKVTGGSALTVKLNAEATEPGNYALTIAAGALCGFSETYDNWLDNPEEISLAWNIKAPVGTVDFSYLATPAPGSTMAELSEAILTFGSLNEVSLAEGALATVTLNGETLEAVNYTIARGEANNQLKVTFSPAITSHGEDIAVNLLFPAASLTGVQGDITAPNTDAISLSYTVVAPVTYDLTLELSRPTQPNADGEISAEKQLDSFFFSSDMSGLVVSEQTETNITIKEVNGDFEASAVLKKAYGLDSSKSYFSAAFNRQPTYNGEYIITVEQGAFGTELWGENHELGRANMAQTLHFILVDGSDRVKYDLEPSEVTPAEGTYGTGAEFATITVKFDTPDVTLSDATVIYATLAGVDTDYREDGVFTANGDGTFTVSFTAPTTDGTYMFNVLQGAFAAAGGRLSTPISREYKLDGKSAITEIEADAAGVKVYNLQGIPVSGKPLPGHIYIINGKKVFVK